VSPETGTISTHGKKEVPRQPVLVRK